MDLITTKRLLYQLNIAVLLAALALFLAPGGYTAADDSIEVIDQSWNAEFRDHITFSLEASSDAEIVEVDLLYQVVGRVATSRNDADFTPGVSVTAEYTIDQTKPENYLPPGAELRYWWKVVDANGNELTTDKETLLYLDDRYPWQKLENDRLALYWYEGGEQFGQALYDRANEALDTLEQDMGIAIGHPIKIFIYGNHRDLLGAISTSAQEWTGGQAFADYGVVVIGVQPVQLEWGLGAMTHEISHLVVHQATDNPFGDLPRWLDEGIAVYNEDQEQLDDDFRAFFERAVEDNALMTLRTLSSPFPADPLEANLAYGQSGAVVMFIVNTYGPEAMADLLDIFAEGALYDEALEQALGVDTDGLDNAFRLSLGLPPLSGAEGATDAVSVESEPDEAMAEPAPEEQAVEAEPAEAASGSTEADSATVSEPPAAEPEPEENRSVRLSDVACAASLLPLLVFGLGAALRRRA